MLRSEQRALLRALIGKPYQAGAVGPEAFDCYGLARRVMRDAFAIRLPDRLALSEIRRSAWRRVALPAEGAVVLMGAGPSPKHIGVFIGGGVLHAVEGAGVVFDAFNMLQFRGFGHFRVYLPA